MLCCVNVCPYFWSTVSDTIHCEIWTPAHLNWQLKVIRSQRRKGQQLCSQQALDEWTLRETVRWGLQRVEGQSNKRNGSCPWPCSRNIVILMHKHNLALKGNFWIQVHLMTFTNGTFSVPPDSRMQGIFASTGPIFAAAAIISSC